MVASKGTCEFATDLKTQIEPKPELEIESNTKPILANKRPKGKPKLEQSGHS